MMNIFINGFAVSGSLIVAIGAQNAFVLKQGLLRQNVFWVALVCFLCDAMLISLGVLGLGGFISTSQVASIALSLLGAGFLFIYGLRAFRSAWQGTSGLTLDAENQLYSRWKTILTTLAITLLNPHVYLDTVMIIGSVASPLALPDKVIFLFGAACASLLWFFSLAYGAKFLTPLFRQAKTWRVLDFIIGLVMWGIAFSLLQYTYPMIVQ